MIDYLAVPEPREVGNHVAAKLIKKGQVTKTYEEKNMILKHQLPATLGKISDIALMLLSFNEDK